MKNLRLLQICWNMLQKWQISSDAQLAFQEFGNFEAIVSIATVRRAPRGLWGTKSEITGSLPISMGNLRDLKTALFYGNSPQGTIPCELRLVLLGVITDGGRELFEK